MDVQTGPPHHRQGAGQGAPGGEQHQLPVGSGGSWHSPTQRVSHHPVPALLLTFNSGFIITLSRREPSAARAEGSSADREIQATFFQEWV